MPVQFIDLLTIDRSHRSKDGFLRVNAKAARSGVQQYTGRDVREADPGREHFADEQVVNVYRPSEEVFDAQAVASFIGRPITDNHPNVPVTAKNWRDHSRGVVGGAVRDGEWLRFDLALMDGDLVDKVDGGKRELSCGYSCDLSIEEGTAPDGTAYQAVQRAIRGNHVAVVDRARAGSEARIADGGNKLFENCDVATVILDALREPEPMPKKITIDGLQVDLSDESAVETAIAKLQGQIGTLTTAKDAAEASVATLTTEKATLDAKVATLETQLADAKLTPAQLRAAAKAYQAVVDQAKALDVTVAEDADEAQVMKAVVAAKVGDAAKDWTDVQIAASFATLTKDAKAEQSDPIRLPTPTTDTAAVETAYDQMVADMVAASKPKIAA